MAQKHFSMSAKQLCASGDKACRAELKRRGRDSSGKKIGSKPKGAPAEVKSIMSVIKGRWKEDWMVYLPKKIGSFKKKEQSYGGHPAQDVSYVGPGEDDYYYIHRSKRFKHFVMEAPSWYDDYDGGQVWVNEGRPMSLSQVTAFLKRTRKQREADYE